MYLRHDAKNMARQKGFQVTSASSIARAQNILRSKPMSFDIVWPAPADKDSIDLLKWLGGRLQYRLSSTGYTLAYSRPSKYSKLRGACDCYQSLWTETNYWKIGEALRYIILRFETNAFVPNRWYVYPKQTIRFTQTDDDTFRQDENQPLRRGQKAHCALRLHSRRERHRQNNSTIVWETQGFHLPICLYSSMVPAERAKYVAHHPTSSTTNIETGRCM